MSPAIPTGGSDQMAGSGEPTPEAPHVVGAAGQPAFGPGWSSAAGVSTAVGSGAARTDHEAPQFWVDPDGQVHLEGVAKFGASAASLIFTLPTPSHPSSDFDYRPAATVEDADGTIEVHPDGSVNFTGSTTSAGSVELRVEYRAAQV